MGAFVFLGGLLILSLVAYCFKLPGRGWLAGLLIFLPLAVYMIFDGVRRLTRITLTFTGDALRSESIFARRVLPWTELVKIRAKVESDDESRIIITLYGRNRTKIRIPQGTFSVPVLDEIIGLIKAQVEQLQGVDIHESYSIWSGWDNYMAVYKKARRK